MTKPLGRIDFLYLRHIKPNFVSFDLTFRIYTALNRLYTSILPFVN